MELVFLPLGVVLFQWKHFTLYEWIVTVLYFIYSITINWYVDIPLNSRLGSFYVGIPIASYLLCLFPHYIDKYPSSVIRGMGLSGIIVAFAAALLIF